MLTKIKLIRNVGCFNQLTCDEELKQTTLIYGENAAGKTTLSQVLRSFARDDSDEILARRRKSATPTPSPLEICLEIDEEELRFQNGRWERSAFAAPVVVFNDFYVDENVYSGLSVEKEQRDNLCQIVLGAESVERIQRLGALKRRRGELQRELPKWQNAELQKYAGPLTVDQFDALPWQEALDEKIAEVDAEIKQAEQAETIKNAAAFEPFSLPAFDSTQVSALLERSLSDVEETTLNRARAHFASLGADGENWAATGLALASSDDVCPFCGQKIRDDRLLTVYRQYFNDEYKRFVTELRSDLDATLAELRDVWSRLNTLKSSLPPKRDYWRQYVPDLPESPDFKSILETVAALGKRFQAVAQDKKSLPLEPLALPDELTAALELYAEARASFLNAYQDFLDANATIRRVQERVARVSKSELLKRKQTLELTRTRYLDRNVQEVYYKIHTLRNELDELQTSIKEEEAELKRCEATVFRDYLDATNRYLGKLRADFTVADFRQNKLGYSGLSVEYKLTINNVKTKKLENEFKYVLSAGDRRTLALAYFFASLENNPNLENAIVVFDDPFTSLDEHRRSATAEHIARLQSQCRQLIVASHSKRFLKEMCGKLKNKEIVCLGLSRFGSQNILQIESKKEWEKNDYDRYIEILRNFYEKNEGDVILVGAVLRHTLEGYCRVAFQPEFPQNESLHHFLNTERKRQETGTSQIRIGVDQLDELEKLDELDILRDDTNPFHHFHIDFTDNVNAGELRGLVKRVLNFVGYRPKEPL
ncbi:MAG: AAA family ATPase [Thermoguttaceae bacterium]|nr:AAA family ATPase [Thermoguttaceae bacterium]